MARSAQGGKQVWVVVVAGGRGARFGSARPKQFLELAGRRVIDWSVEAARSVADGIVVVLPADVHDDAAAVPTGVDAVVAGGASRSASVRAGLTAVPSDAAIVVVHDAARPAAGPELFQAVVRAVQGGAAGAVPGLPVVDTVKRVEHGIIVETLPRESLVRVQTPQAFDAAILRAAHAGEPDATDDAALVEDAGYPVAVVPGDEENRKLTVGPDLALLEEHLAARVRR